jgi:hypothetical protein
MKAFPDQSGVIRPDDQWLVKKLKHKEPSGTYTIAIVGRRNWQGRTEYSYDYTYPDREGSASTSGFYSSQAEAIRKAVKSIRDDIRDERKAERFARMSPETQAAKRAKERMAKAIKFFYKHAGYSHGPGQTAHQRRLEGAKRLALAEEYAKEMGWTVEWDYDELPYEMGDAETKMPDEVLVADLFDEEHHHLESLGGIGDPDGNYRRVVEAELVLEAMPPELKR